MLNFDQFVAGYITCAAWASCLDAESGDSIDGHCYAKETIAKLTNQCIAFYRENKDTLDQAAGLRQSDHLGHDFWLTRNGHGTGFWDRDELGDLGRLLSDKCGWRTNHGECNLYIGDDGLIYLD